MIHGLPNPASAAAHTTPPFWLIVLSFWIFTFGILSWRTGLVVGDEFHLFTARRLLSTIAGAGLFGFVLWKMMSPKAGWAHHPIGAIAAILPAAFCILYFRLLLDWAVFPEPLPIEHNLRWVITWSGYFGLWISGALAFGLHRRPDPARSFTCTYPVERAVEPVARPLPIDPDAWSWLVDALAEELQRHPRADRAALIDRLVRSAGYEVADGPGGNPQDDARILLVRRLACRLLDKT